MAKHLLLAVALLVSMAASSATYIHEDSMFFLQRMPAELEVELNHDESIHFYLEENGTTGYIWGAQYDGFSATVIVSHEGPSHGNDRVGAPGRAKITIHSRRGGHFKVKLFYKRPFESEPIMTVKVKVRNDHDHYDSPREVWHDTSRDNDRRPDPPRDEKRDGGKRDDEFRSDDRHPARPATKSATAANARTQSARMTNATK